ncbi:EF-P beta-lysylation protein EpmB [Marichromatium bheemlicum]|uniref:L-lysine 2,3-aminomutase n=1 Tax=Marichromatium bheemlicum TaxID=365339 RepID=A0ABX1IC72_9GAMM|nr:EF-P beta-lysylation protein EpmB [Marichromatium bheemlicum]NKN34634.1 EF-P beta-lysylation protein EpmB [Marichromatium bheemlicum]
MSSSINQELNPTILPRSGSGCQTQDWKLALRQAITETADLLAALDLERDRLPPLDPDPRPFGLRVPRAFVALMRPGDPDDPLLRQVLPLASERLVVPGFAADPVDDAAADQGDGLLVKYHGRALLITTGACALHCRHCFRRHYPHAAPETGQRRLRAALARLATDRSVNEVILSGGDPLMLDDDRLGTLLDGLEAIGQLRRVRLHSRMPVVLPARVTEALCARLAASRLKPVVVIHANHANELGDAAATALARLRRAGAMLLNQAVLLRGVNDSVAAQCALSERLLDCGVLPYYLHQLDRVQGAAHFQVEDAAARTLLATLRTQLPGYLVPRLVRELPGAAAKLPLRAGDEL